MYMPLFLFLMGKPQALLLLIGQQNHHNQLHNLLGQQLLDLLLDLELLIKQGVSEREVYTCC